jgi:fumarate hydratase class II
MALELSRLTGYSLLSAPNKFAALAAHDAIVTCSGHLRTLAGALMKMANDLRLLASGPRCGLAELILPANEPGSSIMPGKVNPTQCEALTMVAIEVFGKDAAIAWAGSQGHLELNVYKPLMIDNLLHSITLLSEAILSFERHALRGLEPNRERIQELVDRSLMLATALTPLLGYDRVSQLVLQAYRENRTLKEVVLASALVSEADYDRLTDPRHLIP